jgi:hypothetical protein
MSDTLYHLTPDGDAFRITPAEGALQLGAYERRILAGLLLRQLAEYHEKVTGPRDRIGSDLTHNTVGAASCTWQTLASIDRDAAEKFQATYGLPSRWVLGPVVDPRGFLTQGIYHELVDPPVSPPAYVTPSLRNSTAEWVHVTERQKRLRDAEQLRRRIALLDPEEATLAPCPDCGGDPLTAPPCVKL